MISKLCESAYASLLTLVWLRPNIKCKSVHFHLTTITEVNVGHREADDATSFVSHPDLFPEYLVILTFGRRCGAPLTDVVN